MGHIDVNSLRYHLPDGRVLLDEVNFRVGDGDKAALIGANGAGKTTLLRLIAGDIEPHNGAIVRSGGLGVMRQFVDRKSEADSTPPTVRDLLLGVAPPALRKAARELDAAELAMMEDDSEKTQMRYAQAIADWGDAGGYEAETLWDTCTTIALDIPFLQAQFREASTLSGRRAEAARARGPAPRSGPGPPARRAGQLPRRPRQALAGGGDPGDAQDGVVRHARPGAPEPHGQAHRHRGGRRGPRIGRLGVDPRRRLRRTTTRRARRGSTASRSSCAAGRRSTGGSRTS